MSARRKILSNLDNRVHAINEMCTLSGLELEEGREELQRMLREGLVEMRYLLDLPTYKLSFLGRDMLRSPLKVVDNEGATV